MTNLVYWYGTSQDLKNAYSLCKSADLVEYHDGLTELKARLASVKSKEESGKKPTQFETSLAGGVEEVEKDLKKLPSERHGYVGAFLEEYECGSEDETSDQEEALERRQSVKPKDRKKKRGLGKKMKKKAEDTVPEVEVATTAMDANGATKEKKKAKTKGPKRILKLVALDSSKEPRPKKKAKSGGAIDVAKTKPAEDPQASATEPSVEVFEQSEKAPQIGSGEAEAARLSAYEEALAALGDVSSHDEADDDFDDESAASGDDGADRDDDTVGKHKQRKLKSRARKDLPKERPNRKALKAKTKIDKRPRGQKKTASNESAKKAEQHKFEACEKKFLKLIRQWGRAISNNDANQIKRIYVQLLENMDNFTAPFMEVYEMSLLMKQSKAIVNDDKRKEVMAAFKEAYPRKLAKVPEGFKAVKESDKEDAGRDSLPEVDATLLNAQTSTQLSATKPRAGNENTKPPNAVAASTSDKMHAVQDGPSVRSPKSALAVNDSTDPSGDLPASIEKSEVTQQSEDGPLREKGRREQQPQKATPVKPDRKKKFTLGTLMRPAASAPANIQSATNPPSAFRRELSSGSLSNSKSTKDDRVPRWTEVPFEKDRPTDGHRALALEFLEQAAAFIPEVGTTRHDAIVRNLELAIFESAKGSQALANSRKPLRREDNGRAVIRKEENGSATIKKEDQGRNGSQDGNDRFDDETEGDHSEEVEEPWVGVYWGKIQDVAACISGNEKKDGTLATLIGEGKFKTAQELVGLSDEELWKSFQSEPLPRFS